MGNHGFFSESAPTWGPICSITSSHSHSTPSQSQPARRGPYNTKRKMESERIFTETVRDFAKRLFTTAVWKAGLFFIEPNWVDNSVSDNKKLDICLQESYRMAVSQFVAEQTNKDKIPIEKLQNDYLPKTLKGEVCGHLRISYCLS